MIARNPALDRHLSNDLLVRAMDEELSGTEMMNVEMHLAVCDECRKRQCEFQRVSEGFDSFLQSLQPNVAEDERRTLIGKLDAPKGKVRVTRASQPLIRFAWVLATAATLAVGIAYVPFSRFVAGEKSSWTVAKNLSQAGSPFELDGETFLYLPYSNPDLPLNGSHVVQMQVPLSALADAGVMVEPTANRISMPERAVLADVLLGMDGQPIGVHVLSAD